MNLTDINGAAQSVTPKSEGSLAAMAGTEWALVTGAGGFIGVRVVESLLKRGWQHIRCFVRPSSDVDSLGLLAKEFPEAQLEILSGNLLSREDCAAAAKGAKIVFHLVTGRGKSFPGCFQNSVVTTRNLLDALVAERALARFVNVSSFAVHSNMNLKRGGVLDESCEIESNLEERHDAYVYAKLKQDELVMEYHRQHGLPYVTVRPSIVFGRGKKALPGAVGIDTFGFFLHLGGGNRLPLTYVDNCADAIVLAGLVEGIEGQVFNVVDDDLPSSRSFLRNYKREVRRFRSIPVPYSLFYLFCYWWERYARSSQGQLPPVFNRRFCAFMWKRHRFSNQKLKEKLGWKPAVPMGEALQRYYAYQRNGSRHA
jgi:nucleoside-diphosphate-sugar epimerase